MDPNSRCLRDLIHEPTHLCERPELRSRWDREWSARFSLYRRRWSGILHDPAAGRCRHLDTLSCLSATFCAGLAAPSEALGLASLTRRFFPPTTAARLSPTDRSFPETRCVPGLLLDLPLHGSGRERRTRTQRCHRRRGGQDDRRRQIVDLCHVSRRFRDQFFSQLSCVDALHCSVTGLIGITVQNPPQCASVHEPPASRSHDHHDDIGRSECCRAASRPRRGIGGGSQRQSKPDQRIPATSTLGHWSATSP